MLSTLPSWKYMGPADMEYSEHLVRLPSISIR